MRQYQESLEDTLMTDANMLYCSYTAPRQRYNNSNNIYNTQAVMGQSSMTAPAYTQQPMYWNSVPQQNWNFQNGANTQFDMSMQMYQSRPSTSFQQLNDQGFAGTPLDTDLYQFNNIATPTQVGFQAGANIGTWEANIPSQTLDAEPQMDISDPYQLSGIDISNMPLPHLDEAQAEINWDSGWDHDFNQPQQMSTTFDIPEDIAQTALGEYFPIMGDLLTDGGASRTGEYMNHHVAFIRGYMEAMEQEGLCLFEHTDPRPEIEEARFLIESTLYS